MKLPLLVTMIVVTAFLAAPIQGNPLFIPELIRPHDLDLNIGEITSAIGPNHRPHILFTQFGSEDSEEPGRRVIYGSLGDTGWRFETISIGSWRSGDHSLVIDASGRPHIALNDSDALDAIYGVRNDSGWFFESLGTVDSWTVPAIALDPQGRPTLTHFSYGSGGTAATPVIATRIGERDWSKYPSMVSSANRDHQDDPDIIFDRRGVPHMVYSSMTDWLKPWYIGVVSPDPLYGGVLTENRISQTNWAETAYARVSVAADPFGGVRVAATSDRGRVGELIYYAVDGTDTVGGLVTYLDDTANSSVDVAVDLQGNTWLLHTEYRMGYRRGVTLRVLEEDGTLIEMIDLSEIASNGIASMLSDMDGPIGVFHVSQRSGGILYIQVPEPVSGLWLFLLSALVGNRYRMS